MIPASYDFGPRFTGFSYLTTFQIVNNGTDVLNVSDVYSDDPTLFVEEPVGGGERPQASFPLPPGGSRLFNLRWVPTVPMTLDALVQSSPTTRRHPTRRCRSRASRRLRPSRRGRPPRSPRR
ncbi:MAG: hypothetical protein HC882_02215 [Acidobacteria bacterium]|nr:hypothetical protein [Acidobacteriota bacterium]